jgi:hypothetical protein
MTSLSRLLTNHPDFADVDDHPIMLNNALAHPKACDSLGASSFAPA